MIASDLFGTTEASPLRPDAYLVPGYRVLRHIRRGSQFDAYEVWSEERRCSCVVKTPRPVAEKYEKIRADLLREGKHLLSFAHPHLIRAYDVVEDRRPAIVLETLEGGTLECLLNETERPLTAQELARLAGQLCSGVAYLHGKGLLHLNLTPANVSFDFGRAKITDLSTARPPGVCDTSDGAPGYVAPEQASGEGATTTTDVWGVGVILYEAATRQTLFPESRSGAYQQLSHRPVLPSKHRDRLPVELGDVIDACLNQDASARPYPDEVKEWCERIT